MRKENAKINIICIYRERKFNFTNSYILGFPISLCAMSLEGELPKNEKGFLCVIIQCMYNQITRKAGLFCREYTFDHFLQTITLPDRGIPF